MLGYASTVHAARGRTVDTSHTVVTPTTGAPALYVGMCRGRQANVAHVVTRAVPEDAPTGAVPDAVHRSPTAVLAGVLECAADIALEEGAPGCLEETRSAVLVVSAVADVQVSAMRVIAANGVYTLT